MEYNYQTVFISETNSEIYNSTEETSLPTGDAVVAVFDGMPMQNHRLLRGRVIVDDPDDYATGYESKYRIHGTSMVSLAIYGDIKRNDIPISSPVYYFCSILFCIISCIRYACSLPNNDMTPKVLS